MWRQSSMVFLLVVIGGLFVNCSEQEGSSSATSAQSQCNQDRVISGEFSPSWSGPYATSVPADGSRIYLENADGVVQECSFSEAGGVISYSCSWSCELGNVLLQVDLAFPRTDNVAEQARCASSTWLSEEFLPGGSSGVSPICNGFADRFTFDPVTMTGTLSLQDAADSVDLAAAAHIGVVSSGTFSSCTLILHSVATSCLLSSTGHFKCPGVVQVTDQGSFVGAPGTQLCDNEQQFAADAFLPRTCSASLDYENNSTDNIEWVANCPIGGSLDANSLVVRSSLEGLAADNVAAIEVTVHDTTNRQQDISCGGAVPENKIESIRYTCDGILGGPKSINLVARDGAGVVLCTAKESISFGALTSAIEVPLLDCSYNNYLPLVVDQD